jgi:hypothetical protein
MVPVPSHRFVDQVLQSASVAIPTEIFTIHSYRVFAVTRRHTRSFTIRIDAAARHIWRGPLQIAPDLQHEAVDGMHSIDFSGDREVGFLLTLKMRGVKTHSFFDSF